MYEDLDLMQLARSGELLGTVDGVDYRAVHVVFAWNAEGVPVVYCRYQDWGQSHAAKLADKERQITELGQTLERWAAETLTQTQRASAAEARIKELEQQLAERAGPNETPVMINGGDDAPKATDPGACPDCGKTGWKNAHALDVHRGRSHQGMQAPPRAPIQLRDDNPNWRCAEKECSGAFTRDLHDPDHCTQHARKEQTNGVEIAA